MTPILSALLSLGLCLGQRMWTQADTFRRLSLRADTGPLVPRGRNVTLRCQGAPGDGVSLLKKIQGSRTNQIQGKKTSGLEHEFLIPSVTADDAGTYVCQYQRATVWTTESDPLELIVTGLHDAPSLSALPSSQVASGHNVTLQCQSEGWYDRSALYKDGTNITYSVAQPHGRGSQATFSILAVTPTHGGTYQCYTFRNDFPQKWSAPSDPLVLKITALQPTTSSSDTFSTRPGSGNTLFGLSSLQAGILMGISAFIIVLFLFLFLFCHQCWRRQARPRIEGGAAEIKTTGSSDPAGTPQEKNLYAVVNKNRQTEEARPEDPGAPPGEDPQEVTYVQLNLNSLKVEAEDFPHSGPRDPSVYAALQ